MTNIRPRQARALEALASGAKPCEAAQIAGVSDRSLRRWIAKDRVFRDALESLGREAVRLAEARLRTLGEAAAEALEQILRDPEAPPATRVAAARVVLDRTRGIQPAEAMRDTSTLEDEKAKAAAMLKELTNEELEALEELFAKIEERRARQGCGGGAFP